MINDNKITVINNIIIDINKFYLYTIDINKQIFF